MKDTWNTVTSRSSAKSGLLKWVQEYDKERHSSGDSSSSSGTSTSTNGTPGSNPEVISFFPHMRKNRSVSESGELPRRWPRGILKNRSMSLTESSEDMVMTSQSSMEFTESCDDDSSTSKKSVRFNELVSRRFFRSTSSIMEQKKKNVKREYRRKEALARASLRRSSESEASNSESEERHQPLADQVFGIEGEEPWVDLSLSCTSEKTKGTKSEEDKDEAVSSDDENTEEPPTQTKPQKKNSEKKKRRNRRNKKQERKNCYEGMIQSKLLKGNECKSDDDPEKKADVEDAVERTNQLTNDLIYELEE